MTLTNHTKFQCNTSTTEEVVPSINFLPQTRHQIKLTNCRAIHTAIYTPLKSHLQRYKILPFTKFRYVCKIPSSRLMSPELPGSRSKVKVYLTNVIWKYLPKRPSTCLPNMEAASNIMLTKNGKIYVSYRKTDMQTD